QRGVYIVDGNAVIKVAQRFIQNGFGLHTGETGTGFADDQLDATHIQGLYRTVIQSDVNAGQSGSGGSLGSLALLCTQPCALLAIQNVVEGYLVLTSTHQGQFYLVLDFLNVNGSAGRHAAFESLTDLLCQVIHQLADTAGGSGRATFYRQEGLGEGDGDLAVFIRYNGAVALDDTNFSRCSGGQGRAFSPDRGGGICAAFWF